MEVSNPTHDEFRFLLSRARAPRLRTPREFAEQEIVIPDGEHKGRRFEVARQPFVGPLLDLMAGNQWFEFFISGPSQSGKTFIAFILPAIYHCAELCETYIVAIPDMKMANNKWKVDLEPVFRASPKLERLLPTAGPGSRGGEVKDSITLTNGALLKFMSAGGDDTNKAGFTSRCIGVTEAARFSKVGETSVEADPLRQIRARQRSYDRHRRRLYVEGTVTTDQELPMTARPQSTRSRLLVPCPHCAEWILPGREHLHGWQDARSEIEAADKASFFCPACGEAITDEERTACNRDVRLVHDGQAIDKQGRVTGEPPETTRLWFHWQAFHNLFVRTGDFGAEEWLASKLEDESAEKENAEKMLCQFVHSIPYTPPDLAETVLDASAVSRRVEQFPRGVLPADTTHLTIGVDCGKWTSWFVVIAFRANKTLHIPAYGALDVVTGDDAERTDVKIALLNCLRRFRDLAEVGFPQEGRPSNRLPDAIWVDSGWENEVVFSFVRGSNQGRWLPSLGRGASQLEKYRYVHPKKLTNEVRKIGDHWHVRRNQAEKVFQATFDADYWKLFVQERLSTPLGEPGSLALYTGADREHTKISKHFTNETLKKEFVPGKGIKEYWHKTGQNHYLDCAAGACAAGDYVGFRLVAKTPTTFAPPAGGWFGKQKAGAEHGEHE